MVPSHLEAGHHHGVHTSGMKTGAAGHEGAAMGTGTLAQLSSLWVCWPSCCCHHDLVILYLQPQNQEPAWWAAISVQVPHLDNLL